MKIQGGYSAPAGQKPPPPSTGSGVKPAFETVIIAGRARAVIDPGQAARAMAAHLGITDWVQPSGPAAYGATRNPKGEDQ